MLQRSTLFSAYHDAQQNEVIDNVLRLPPTVLFRPFLRSGRFPLILRFQYLLLAVRVNQRSIYVFLSTSSSSAQDPRVTSSPMLNNHDAALMLRSCELLMVLAVITSPRAVPARMGIDSVAVGDAACWFILPPRTGRRTFTLVVDILPDYRIRPSSSYDGIVRDAPVSTVGEAVHKYHCPRKLSIMATILMCFKTSFRFFYIAIDAPPLQFKF